MSIFLRRCSLLRYTAQSYRYSSTMVKVDHKQAALDFLSFVNASPTRKNDVLIRQTSPSNTLQPTMLSSPAKSFSQQPVSKRSKCVDNKTETFANALADHD